MEDEKVVIIELTKAGCRLAAGQEGFKPWRGVVWRVQCIGANGDYRSCVVVHFQVGLIGIYLPHVRLGGHVGVKSGVENCRGRRNGRCLEGSRLRSRSLGETRVLVHCVLALRFAVAVWSQVLNTE